MFTRIATTHRRTAAIGAGVLLLAGAAALTATAASSGGTAHPKQPSHRYADYLGGDQNTGDPCALPVAQRSGGWVCPEGGGH